MFVRYCSHIHMLIYEHALVMPQAWGLTLILIDELPRLYEDQRKRLPQKIHYIFRKVW